MRAHVTVSWPEEPLPALALPADLLMERLGGLWAPLADAVTENGPGCLWALRWEEGAGWQVLSVPPHDAGDGPVAETPGSRERDAWVVASALAEIAFGRRPRDLADAYDLLDLHAGTVLGLDAVVHALFSGGNPAQVHAVVQPGERVPVLVRAAAETAVGSGKAGYDPECDNEDSLMVARIGGGVLALGVCDGVTGSGDGSGALASRIAVREMRDVLTSGGDVMKALAAADKAVQQGTFGASTALVATLAPDGTAELYSIGDSPAWLVRRRRRGGRIAFRLTPDQTVLAEARRTDPDASIGGSHLTQNLGGKADEPYRATIEVQPGDLLVLMSDGAAIPDHGWFGLELAAMAEAHPTAPALAAALTARAERLGGRDNATAVIAEIHATP
ncbi:PP2C family protein-serine/threonine phosphatase [Actinocorallia longicatena]|uniref:PPM-type phosphatase domain-containing protein n=1 Tax=Actinocorallia longicatena TaxID=111803 RepID=A0ABP6QL10_9ACTN